MQFSQLIHCAGEHPLQLEGSAGLVEAVLTIPEVMHSQAVALLGHPHSLQGGTMNNKVVTTMAKALKELNIPSLRFNFRGVGQSEGQYDDGLGESEDMLLFAEQWREYKKDAQFIFAGFSFGSYVAYRAASHHPQSMLVTIAPPVHHYNYKEFHPDLASWLLVQGTEDEVVPYYLVEDFVRQEKVNAITMVTFADTGHFFHGKLLDLKSHLIDYVQSRVHA
jgi:alpha/beta superfamily hydrolase